MADLDDFFAKKDKKKSRVVKKFTNDLLSSKQTDDVAAIQALPKKPAEPKKREEPKEIPLAEGEAPKPHQKPQETLTEEEWGEFEQEKERDYSGLKIQKLQIQDGEDNEDDYDEQELNEEGELVRREPVGPWNKTNAQPTTNGMMLHFYFVDESLLRTYRFYYLILNFSLLLRDFLDHYLIYLSVRKPFKKDKN